jgi:hypothetical protein
VAEKNKKILKRRKKENPKKTYVAGYPITTPHSWNPLAWVGGDQLQPGVEDGETPTEVGAEENPKKKKTRKSQKKGGPWIPGRGGSKNISSRAFLILWLSKLLNMGK